MSDPALADFILEQARDDAAEAVSGLSGEDALRVLARLAESHPADVLAALD